LCKVSTMSSSDSGFNDNAKNFNDEATSSDGYGGMAPFIYEAIVAFKKDGTYPSFCDLKGNRNAHFHWRIRCKNFTVTDTGVLLYSGNNSSAARAVVRVGETRLAMRFIHEKTGHAAQKQTVMVCARRLYWRSMRRDITRFINECEFCRRKKEIRRNDLPLSHIGSAPAVRPSRSEEAEMRAVADRLLLNTDGELEQYYRGPALPRHEEVVTYEVFEDDDGAFHRVLEDGMMGGGLMVDDDEETEVATTLSGMNGSTYIVVQRQQPSQQLKVDEEDDSRSTPGGGGAEEEEAGAYGDYEDDDDGGEMPMIVADAVIPAVSNEIVRTMEQQQQVQHRLHASPSKPPLLLPEQPLMEEEGEGEREEEEEVEVEVEVGGSPQGIRGEEATERCGQRGVKRRLLDPISLPSAAAVGIQMYSNKTKKRLLEENQALRSRLGVLESLHTDEQRAGALASVAMQMAPIDEETAAMQKSLLLMQREVLQLQRTYWQSKVQQARFMQLPQYYAEEDDEDVVEAAGMVVGGRGGGHYGMVEEEEEEHDDRHHRVMV
ncbi:hypothetical protein PFISCL1PPCAC_28792, partial [Pristionchus fissidentatus]